MKYIVMAMALFVMLACNTSNKTTEDTNKGERFDYIKTKKKRLYYDAEGTEVTPKDFATMVDYAFVIDRNLEYDTYYESRLFYRDRFGKLSTTRLNNFIANLEASTGLDIDSTVPIKIGYFHEDEPSERCTFFYHSEHWANLLKRWQYNYFSIANNKVIFEEQVSPCSHDSLRVMERLFFNQKIACGNWMVVKPDGSYRIFYGEGGPMIFEEKELVEWDEAFIEHKTKRR